ncbi:hypothetical protein ACT691_10025 [Vibrio metschnikovii]
MGMFNLMALLLQMSSIYIDWPSAEVAGFKSKLVSFHYPAMPSLP